MLEANNLLGSYSMGGKDGLPTNLTALNSLSKEELGALGDNSPGNPVQIIHHTGDSFQTGNFISRETHPDGYVVQMTSQEGRMVAPCDPWATLMRDHGFKDPLVRFAESSSLALDSEKVQSRSLGLNLGVEVYQGTNAPAELTDEQVCELMGFFPDELIHSVTVSGKFCLRAWGNSQEDRSWTGIRLKEKAGETPFPYRIQLQQIYVHQNGVMVPWRPGTHDSLRKSVFEPEDKWADFEAGIHPSQMSELELMVYAIKMDLFDEPMDYDTNNQELMEELYEEWSVDYHQIRRIACETYEGQVGRDLMAGDPEPLFIDALGWTSGPNESYSPGETLAAWWVPSGVPYLEDRLGSKLPHGCPLLLGWVGDTIGSDSFAFETTITLRVSLYNNRSLFA